MYRQKYGDARQSTPVNNQNSAAKLNRFFNGNFTQNHVRTQCKKCGSDYMKFAVDGFCQNCQQKVEFIIRERPELLAKAGGAARV